MTTVWQLEFVTPLGLYRGSITFLTRQAAEDARLQLQGRGCRCRVHVEHRAS